jgi:hypothetical protein
MQIMIKLAQIFVAIVSISLLTTSCIQDVEPQGGSPSAEQVSSAPGAFDGLVSALTSSLTGTFEFGSGNTYPWDFGYPTFYLMRDFMGQDIVGEPLGNDWYITWYAATTSLGPDYLYCQVPWTYYYQWINGCNTVIALVDKENPDPAQVDGLGIAYTMRAMFYMDLARMFQFTYVKDTQAPTVPIVTEETTLEQATNNPRAPQETMWEFILSDLDKAEQYIANYKRTDVYTPDISVVYGLKARAYLTMEKWADAEKYAKLAQAGFTPMNEAQYTDRMTAFNTPNSSWIFGLKFNPNSDNILLNDSDSNWGSQMFLEVKGGLYGSSYGVPRHIDAHLYQTIPDTDFRKNCFMTPELDEMDAETRTATIIERYSDYPHYLDVTAESSTSGVYGYLALKFRAAGGAEGRENPYKATAASVPMMRVEEMMLIEAEAAGMQNEAQGKALLTAFAQLRDPEYVYDEKTSFRDNVWWQRRVELWGEGFATFDIKRLQKGIIRNYAGTNHGENYRWNTTEVPQWMNLCIVRTEGNYNFGLGENNPTPVAPAGDSPEYVW